MDDQKKRNSAPADANILASLKACVDHGRALVASAQATLQIGHHNIAYHLAALALEEIGRFELIKLRTVKTEMPSWLQKHSENHVQKLFWCFFTANFFHEKLSPKSMQGIQDFARAVHAKRLAGLYVGATEEELTIPADAIDRAEVEAMLRLAESRVEIAADETPVDEIPPEAIELQAWFLETVENPEHRPFVFSNASMEKLSELKDGQKWAIWLRQEIDKRRVEGEALVAAELKRSERLPEKGTRYKWKIKFRLICQSHSIRQKALKVWNAKCGWIVLSYVDKTRIDVEILIKDHIPIQALWYHGWAIARHFVTSVNLATMGFWWWRMPQDIDAYYTDVYDLDQKNLKIKMGRRPSLKIDWGANRALTEADMERALAAFAALAARMQSSSRSVPYDYYIGGLTFLSLNDVHWQCEPRVFGNFAGSLKEMMEETGEWVQGTPFAPAVMRYVKEFSPKFDEEDRYTELYAAFEQGSMEGTKVNLKDASIAKTFCDAYFLHKLQPRYMDEMRTVRSADDRSTSSSVPE